MKEQTNECIAHDTCVIPVVTVEVQLTSEP